MDKKSSEKTEMTLKGYYDNLPYCVHPKLDFVTRIMNECNVSSNTARNWIRGLTKPINSKHVEILSDITGIPAARLWA